jgi:hypothetical protein
MRRGSLIFFYSRMFDWGMENLKGEKRDQYIAQLNEESDKLIERWEKEIVTAFDKGAMTRTGKDYFKEQFTENYE